MRTHSGPNEQTSPTLTSLVWVVVIACAIVATSQSGYGQSCQISTPVRVLDKDSHPLMNLAADQFKVQVGGVSAQVLKVSPGEPPGMVLFLDASGSMKHSWVQSIAAAKQLASSTEHIAVVVFREGLLLHANGHSETFKLLDELASKNDNWGGTPLYDALIQIATGVGKQNVALVVITDGQDNMSQHSADETAALFLRSSWPPVFGLVIDYDHEGPRREYFKKIVIATGGLIVRPPSASEVLHGASELAGETASVYNVTLQTKQLNITKAKLKLELAVADKNARRGIQIAHVAEVTGCDPNSAH
jgi:hypothetical protein